MFRHSLLMLAFLAVTPATAGTREDVYSASQRCSAISDDRAWLNCYYGAATTDARGQLQLLPTAPGFPNVSLVPPPKRAGAVDGAVDSAIGFLIGGDAIVSHVSIKSYETDRQGGFTVVLMNGQVWKQSDEQIRLVNWHNRPRNCIRSRSGRGAF